MPLKQYNKKRHFKKTPEPKGAASNKHKNLFVVQKHDARHLHYDFRLELNGVLLSWAVPKGPCLDPSVKRLAVHVENHPVSYGHFEGTIPKGQYGAGTVMLWDVGTWTSEDEDPVKAYKKGHLRFTLKAKKLNGSFSLVRLRTDDKSWLLIKGNDKYAKPLSEYDVLEEKPDSVNKPLKKKPKLNLPTASMPNKIDPQLATLVTMPPETDNWLHELKFDGYRMIAFKNGDNVRLMTRNQNNWTTKFKNIADAVKKLPVDNLILDGEIVMLNESNKPDFQLLQNSLKQKNTHDFIYYIFDIIYYDKYKLSNVPLIKRKEILKNIISENDDQALRFSSYAIGSGKKIFAKSCQMGMEGIISKAIDSSYQEKRTKTWLKIKCIKRQEFVIGGYTKPKGARGGFGSLLLGIYNDKKELIYCGNVGTGFTQSSLQDIYQKLQRYKCNNNPFNSQINSQLAGASDIVWVKPTLICEVEFIEWTADGRLRHPSFQGLRGDKPASQVIKESGMTVNSNDFLTNPDKALYPEEGITKLDLVNYYRTVQRWILPYIINRPLTLLRCPENYHECFYQKHLNKEKPKGIERVVIKEKTKTENYLYIKNVTGLLSLAQLGVLEIHPWGSDIKKLNFPDMIIFDLDPAPDVSWKKVVAAAKLLKKELAKLKLKSFVKTTGGKGLHVVIPIKPEYDWHKVKLFAHTFVKFIVMNHPDDFVASSSKAKRKGKIFIDYLRNQKGATAIAPYSTRARAGAPVSTPLRWEELSDRAEDNFYTIFTLPARLKKLKKDPWHDFFKVPFRLPV